MMADQDVSGRNQVILAERLAAWNENRGPRVGDWVRIADGSELQVAYDWGDSVQLTIGGSFYIGNGIMSFSGSLEPGIPADGLALTSEMRPGLVWFFHHDIHRAHNAVHAYVDCRVWVAR